MRRRTFLQRSSLGLGALPFIHWSCSSTKESVADASSGVAADAVSETYRVGREHLVFEAGGVRARLDPHGHTVRAVAGGGSHTIAEAGQGTSEVNFPIDAAAGADERLFVLDHGNHRIVPFGGDGRAGASFGELSRPRGLLLARSGELYVCDVGRHEVQVFDQEGFELRAFSGAPDHALNGPCALAEDGHGRIHVVDAGNHRVVVFSPDGQALASYGEDRLGFPRSIAIDARDRVCIGEAITGFVHVFDAEGRLLERFRPLDEDGQAVAPLALTIDHEGLLYVWAPALHDLAAR